MPARAAWKGFLHVSQLAVPVRAFAACRRTPEIALNQLHRGCGDRVREQRYCPVHGAVASEEIVSGFEYEQGRYLPLEPDDLEQLLPEDEKTIAVDCFVPSATIDPVYHSGRTYYLVPDGPPGQRPFGVLRDGLHENNRHGLARVVMGHRELLVLVRPLGRLLAMTVLEYPQRIRAAADYETEVAGLEPGPLERNLVSELIAAMTDPDIDLSRYRDRYVDGLNDLIERRLADAAAVTAADGDEAALVAALRESLSDAGDVSRKARATATSETGHDTAERRRLG